MTARDGLGAKIIRAVFCDIPGEIIDCNCPGFDDLQCRDLALLGDCHNANYQQVRAQ